MKRLINTGFLPYDSDLTKRARKNRKTQTEAEQLLWDAVLKSKQLKGYKFTRQKPIYRYILDFYCSELSLGIEVDGGSHKDKQDYDERRTFLLNGFGVNIVRFSNKDVINNLDSVRTKLLKYISNQEATSK